MIDQNKIPRAFIFIDAQYLYKIQKHFEKIHNRKLKTDLHKLGTYLAKEQGIWCEEIRYFTAPPYQHPNPTPDEVQRRAGYDRLVSSLRKIPGFSVREGRCQFVEGEYHQKGVDTLVTMDLMSAAMQKSVRKIILIACDTDFVPVLNHLRQHHEFEIILYYYTDRERGSSFSMSNHILTACDKCVPLNRAHLENNQRKERSAEISSPK
ncbi:MAG: NYN domain-containing protein [Nanoarchaeota archaeon]